MPKQAAMTPESIARNFRKWLEGRGSETTGERWGQIAHDFLRDLWTKKQPKRPEDFTKEDILNFMAVLKKRRGKRGEPYKDSTRRTMAGVCVSLYKFLKVPRSQWAPEAWERGDLPRGDAADRPQPTYTLDEMLAIVEAAKDNPRDYAWHSVWAEHMPRRREIMLMRVKDFQTEQGRAYKLFIQTAKHGIQANVTLSKRTAKRVLAYLKTRSITSGDEPLFAAEDGGQIDTSDLNTIHGHYCRKAGIQCKGLHAGRRGLTTWLDEEGVQASDIQRIGRWKTPSMPFRYIQRDRKKSEEKLINLHPFYSEETPQVITPSIPAKITRITKITQPPKKPKKVVDWMEQYE